MASSAAASSTLTSLIASEATAQHEGTVHAAAISMATTAFESIPAYWLATLMVLCVVILFLLCWCVCFLCIPPTSHSAPLFLFFVVAHFIFSPRCLPAPLSLSGA